VDFRRDWQLICLLGSPFPSVMENGMLAVKNPVKKRPASPLKAKRLVAFAKTRKFLQNDRSSTAAESGRCRQDLSSASVILSQLIEIDEVKKLLDPQMRPNSRMVYSKGVTIWMLILQRLHGGATLEETVSHVLEHDRELLPENKRTSEFTLSANPSSYSAARRRLDIQDVQAFSNLVCDYLARVAAPIVDNRRVFLLDGTTITLEPTAELTEAFPPAPNQHGQSVWPVAMLMVAAEMQTGCALLPQVDPMYGPSRSSEAKQSAKIVRKLPPGSIVMADSGFGIFSVAYHARRAEHDFLFRLTKSRFCSMVKKATVITSTDSHSSYRLHWCPSIKDRKTNPELPGDVALDVILHRVDLDDGEQLYLVSSLDFDAASAAQLYSHRYEIEFDIRDLKVTMDAENLRARSVDMAMKELMASVIAFNLTMQFRRQAAKLAKVTPRRLSFKSCWVIVQNHLLLAEEDDFEDWQIRFARALTVATEKKLPQRSAPRSYPRKAHPRRPKSTKFMKTQVKDPSESPPMGPK
jgi:hypothetical protein